MSLLSGDHCVLKYFTVEEEIILLWNKIFHFGSLSIVPVSHLSNRDTTGSNSTEGSLNINK